MTRTAIVILNWNGLEFLKMFLNNIIDCSDLPGTKIIVADNNSDDGSLEWIVTNFKNVEIIKLDKNLGYAGGYKIALRKIEAEFFVLLNSDVEVSPGWLDPMIDFMNENPDVAACQPKILSFKNRDTFEYAGAAGGFIDRYGYPFCRGRIMNFIEKDFGQYDDHCEIFWASGACIMIRSDAYFRCFGFDEDFFAHMEEIDLCWRFQNAGYRILCIPESTVYHVGGGTLAYKSVRKTYLNFRNSLFLLYKNLPQDKLFTTLFFRKILDGISAIIFLLTGKPNHFLAVFKAHRDYYRELNNLKKKRFEIQGIALHRRPDLILNKSVVLEFYIKRKKTWNSLFIKTDHE